MYDHNCTLFINNFLKCNYLADVIIKIYIHFEYHEFNAKGWDLSKRVRIVRLRICQRAFLNYGMHIWSSLRPEIKHSTAFHEIKWMSGINIFVSLNPKDLINYSAMYNGISVCMLTYVHIGMHIKSSHMHMHIKIHVSVYLCSCLMFLVYWWNMSFSIISCVV